jgi:uncharacterized protein
MEKALIIFVKNAQEGTVKTRLAATVGNSKALFVYKQLLKHTMEISSYVKARKFVFYSSFIEQEDEWDNKVFTKKNQSGDNLGERMKNAFAEVFSEGHNKICIIGCDCPSLNKGIVEAAYAALELHDVVVGPAFDGGYYLIGMKELHPRLFEGIDWSTPTVFEKTISICKSGNLNWSLLPVLHDVDEEKDLVHFQEILTKQK